ncbi:GNAT family N-acetyltransferase [Paenarthrobacter nicotinovorans]|uniref:GNAT family N-acetyltransferase n=1 Tax=Paenarthrobacter nicotinovorans TaxID=29320 RepID=UPI00380E04F6
MYILHSSSVGDFETFLQWEQSPETSIWLGATSLEWHQRAQADPDQAHLVARDGQGDPFGFVVLAGLLKGNGTIELRRLVIDMQKRGNGRGRKLFRSAVEHAYASYGAERIWLDVKRENTRARDLYKSEGFDLVENFSHLTDPEVVTKLDLVVMEHVRRSCNS